MLLKRVVQAAVAALAIAATAPASAQQVLKVGSTPTGIPFTFLDTKTNTIQGVMVDLITEVGKDAGFAVTDRINIYYRTAGALRAQLAAMGAYIKNETLSTEFSDEYRAGEYASTLEINGETIEVGIERRAHV